MSVVVVAVASIIYATVTFACNDLDQPASQIVVVFIFIVGFLQFFNLVFFFGVTFGSCNGNSHSPI